MSPWVPDRKAEGGYTFIHSIVCKKCSYVIKDDDHIFEGGRYECPKCGYKGGGPAKTDNEKPKRKPVKRTC